VNEEEQYSIWPAYRENPLGGEMWASPDQNAECLGYIEKAWAEMRPLSVRKKWACRPLGREAPILPVPFKSSRLIRFESFGENFSNQGYIDLVQSDKFTTTPHGPRVHD